LELKTIHFLVYASSLFLLVSCASPKGFNQVENPVSVSITPVPLTSTLPATAASLPSTPTFFPTDTATSKPTETPLPPSATTTSTPLASPDGIAGITAFISDLSSQDQFSGAVLVGKGDEIVWEYAHGLADREENIPNRLDTRFNLGSMNKMFTAVAILQLKEAGLLSLDDTIAAVFPDYPNPEVAGQVSIHQLLTHTSGMGDSFTEVFQANPNQFRSDQDYLPLFVNEPLQFQPGTQFSYSNAGYNVLGLIIEALSNQPYDDYIRQHIFEPSGMFESGSFSLDDEVPNLAIGYTTQDAQRNETGVLSRNSALMPGKGSAAGGGYSTVGDLFKFRVALFGYDLLSPADTDLLTTGKVAYKEDSQYAYGFFDLLEAGHRMVGHSGGAQGVCSFMNTYPETGYTVIVLSNSDYDCAAVLDYLRESPLE
jgi:D-alanyl-D-alanine carboxypeptidase